MNMNFLFEAPFYKKTAAEQAADLRKIADTVERGLSEVIEITVESPASHEGRARTLTLRLVERL